MCGSQRRLNPSIWNIQKNLGRPESWNNHARILMGKTCQTNESSPQIFSPSWHGSHLCPDGKGQPTCSADWGFWMVNDSTPKKKMLQTGMEGVSLWSPSFQPYGPYGQYNHDATANVCVVCVCVCLYLLMRNLKLLLIEETLHQFIGSLSNYLQCFIHPRSCRISSINSIVPLLFSFFSC